MTHRENISDRLLAIRKAHGFTQTELALELGLSLSYIHQLESGKRGEPSPSIIKLLDLWETVSANRQDLAERREQEGPIKAPPDPGPLMMNEKPVVGYRVGASPPCPLHDEALRQRLRTLASQSGLSEETLITAALTQFVEECESSGKVSVSLKLNPPPVPPPHPPQPGGGDDKKKDRPSAQALTTLTAEASCVECEAGKV